LKAAAVSGLPGLQLELQLQLHQNILGQHETRSLFIQLAFLFSVPFWASRGGSMAMASNKLGSFLILFVTVFPDVLTEPSRIGPAGA
jgi:hypothetical protein